MQRPLLRCSSIRNQLDGHGTTQSTYKLIILYRIIQLKGQRGWKPAFHKSIATWTVKIAVTGRSAHIGLGLIWKVKLAFSLGNSSGKPLLYWTMTIQREFSSASMWTVLALWTMTQLGMKLMLPLVLAEANHHSLQVLTSFLMSTLKLGTAQQNLHTMVKWPQLGTITLLCGLQLHWLTSSMANNIGTRLTKERGESLGDVWAIDS